MILEQEFNCYLEIPGEIRGAAFQTDAEYIRTAIGSDGLRRIESALKIYGIQLSYDAVRAMAWIPLRTRALSMAMMHDFFGWQDRDFYAMGDVGSKHSFIIRLLAKFFASPRAVFNNAPVYWSKYYSVGRISPVRFNENDHIVTLELVNFKVHSMYCRYLEGFFRRLVQHNFPKHDVKVEETKCVFKGDEVHEYFFRW